MTHTLNISTQFDDGHESSWFYVQPGDATEAHDNLAKRWQAAGYDFDRDRASLTLVRRVTDKPEIGEYVDTVQHQTMGEA